MSKISLMSDKAIHVGVVKIGFNKVSRTMMIYINGEDGVEFDTSRLNRSFVRNLFDIAKCINNNFDDSLELSIVQEGDGPIQFNFWNQHGKAKFVLDVVSAEKCAE